MSSQQDDPLAGTQYRALRLIGQGGMGDVYLAEHLVLGKEVVAKLLRPEFARDPGVIERMRIEAQSLAALSHPNIVSVTDFGKTAAERPFYIMERLEGQTVGQLLRHQGPPALAYSVEIVRQVLDALGAAHALGLIHRDIKPDNVFLHRDSTGALVVKLLDFGIAKVSAGSSRSGAPAPSAIPTAEGAIIGTPRYISPEQILGRTVDHRADLYTVGLLLYALATGEAPFEHLRTTKQLFEAHLRTVPPNPSLKDERIPGRLDRIVQRALEKRPEDRFQDAAEFAVALGAQPSTQHPHSVGTPAVRERSLGSRDTMLSPTAAQAHSAGRDPGIDLAAPIANGPALLGGNAEPGEHTIPDAAVPASRDRRAGAPAGSMRAGDARVKTEELHESAAAEPPPAKPLPEAPPAKPPPDASPASTRTAPLAHQEHPHQPRAPQRPWWVSPPGMSAAHVISAYVATAAVTALEMGVVVIRVGVPSASSTATLVALTAFVGTSIGVVVARFRG
ncbi:MAG: serine/threonine-protein kinase [Polyangiaceae bacterium]